MQQQGCNRYAYIVVVHYTGFEGLLLGRWLDGLYNRFENVPLGDSARGAGGWWVPSSRSANEKCSHAGLEFCAIRWITFPYSPFYPLHFSIDFVCVCQDFLFSSKNNS